jgi:2,3-bisphosphoglycerate-dependent phosphoglycerate mutase
MKPAMQLYMIRHAQSHNNAKFLSTGSSKYRDPDPELTEIGKKQIEYLASFLRGEDKVEKALGRDPHDLMGFNITHLYCSLMVRAVETGMAIANALGLPLMAWRDIHETGGIIAGDGESKPYTGLPGKPRSFFEKKYPNLVLLDEFGEEGWWNRDFEEVEERQERAKRVVKFLEDKHLTTDDRVVIVTHGAFYNHLMREMIGIRERTVWFAMGNTAITKWDYREDQWEQGKTLRILDYTNRLDFLPKELITP